MKLRTVEDDILYFNGSIEGTSKENFGVQGSMEKKCDV
jgi:hypothetical protein